MNHTFAEATTSTAFLLTLTRRQCNTLLRLREHERLNGKPHEARTFAEATAEGPAHIAIVQVDNLNPLAIRGLVSWGVRDGKACGFQGLTKAGELMADLLVEAGMTIESTNTLSVLRRLERAA